MQLKCTSPPVHAPELVNTDISNNFNLEVVIVGGKKKKSSLRFLKDKREENDLSYLTGLEI